MRPNRLAICPVAVHHIVRRYARKRSGVDKASRYRSVQERRNVLLIHFLDSGAVVPAHVPSHLCRFAIVIRTIYMYLPSPVPRSVAIYSNLGYLSGAHE